MMTRKMLTGALAAGALPILTFSLACGGRQTTASKSAAAYEEAKRKGVPVGGGEGHEGHAQAGAEASPAPDNGAHATPAHEAAAQKGEAHAGHPGAAGTGHAKAPGSRSGAPAGHGAHTPPEAGGMPGHQGHTPSAAGVSPLPMAGMDHSRMDHAGMAHAPGMPMAPPKPEPASAVANPGQPAATLRGDALDGPASTSVGDAARSAAVAAEMAAGGHAMAHGTYSQTDAGRDSVAPAQPPGAGHEGHGAAPRPKPSPTPDPHSMHWRPSSPRPSPSPNNEEDHR